MSTKELYTALHTARMDKTNDVIQNMDEAIRQLVQAERGLNFLNQYHGSDDLFRRRLKLILCEQVARNFKPILPADVMGSEAEQLQTLANAADCPKITAWLGTGAPVPLE